MSAFTYPWQIFAPAEGVEDGLFNIFTAQGIPAQKRFESKTNVTPRVELQVILGDPKKSVSPMVRQFSATNAQMQPIDSWGFILLTTVVTNRTENGNQHVPLIGHARYNLQYFRLKETFTTSVAPYHSISSIEEVSQQDSVDDAGNIQSSQLTFAGILNIRESAWSQ